MIIKRIISGGQTGADQGGLAAAKELGLETGGWMPLGWRTDAGPRPDLRDLYGMLEHHSPQYPPRTEANVLMSRGTLIFGNAGSPGSYLTVKLCTKHGIPFYLQRWRTGDTISEAEITAFRGWLFVPGPETLNVAGNRERSQPGIHDACRDFLVSALGKR